MNYFERLEKTADINNAILQLKIEAILSTFDEEQTIRYKAHLNNLLQDGLKQLEKTSTAEQIQKIKNIVGL